MTIYAIGDVQGCFDELDALLTKINFNRHQDILWFTGDLVNRGPKSLETLRFIKSLGPKHKIVLGNHDLHLLAIYYGIRPLNVDDTLHSIMHAADRDEIIQWLRHQPLLHFDSHLNYLLVHAGLSPAWTVSQALKLAHEVETALQSEQVENFLQQIYGNFPDKWNDNLQSYERLRCITNFCTRVRLCTEDGQMDFSYKGDIKQKPSHLIPWFLVPSRKNRDVNIIFGHWAALEGETATPHIFALDTGCVWGNCLTALRLSDGERIQVPCFNKK